MFRLREKSYAHLLQFIMYAYLRIQPFFAENAKISASNFPCFVHHVMRLALDS